jgi:hypothetical protein
MDMVIIRHSTLVVRRFLRPWHIVGLMALAYIALTLWRYGGDPMTFALVGTYYDPRMPDGSIPLSKSSFDCPGYREILGLPQRQRLPGETEGYDGQFAYQIARDPLGASCFLDVPAYRYQRILYPMVARVLALVASPLRGAGTERGLIPWTLIAVNWLALVAGTGFTESLLTGRGVSRWYALSYGLFGGLMMAVRLDLTEPLAYALVQAAVLGYERGPLRARSAAGALALAALAKETTLLVAAGFLLSFALSRRWRDLIEWTIIVGVPFAAFQVFLRAWLGAWGIGSGGALATPFEWIPYRGLWSLAAVNGRAFVLIALIVAPMALIPALVALVAALRDVARRDVHPLVCVLLVNALVIPFTPQSTLREPLGMLRLIVGLVVAVIAWGAYHRSRRALNYSLFWIATLALAVNESRLPA